MDEIKIVCTYDYSAEGLEHIFAQLDLLHDLASEGRLSEATSLRASDVIGWLEDIVFTAEETVREIDAHTPALHAFVETQPRRVEQHLTA
jgi:hypothetical protein